MYRSKIGWFADLMERKLNQNSWKGGWGRSPKCYLIRRLRQEVDELEKALSGRKRNRDPDAIADEAADVANFAMMLADNEREAHR